MLNGGSHVVVFILSKATTEEDVLFGVREGFVLGVERGVSFIVNGIVWLHARLPLGGILTADYGFGIVIDRLAERFEMLVLDDASIGNIVRGVVDNRIALVVADWDALVGIVEIIVVKDKAQRYKKSAILARKICDSLQKNLQFVIFSIK